RKRTGELLRTLFESLMQFPDGLAVGDALKKNSRHSWRRRGAVGEMGACHPVFDLEMADHSLDRGTRRLERQQATVHLVGDLGWPCPPLSAVPRMMSTAVYRGLSDAYAPGQPAVDSTKRAADGRTIREQRFRVRRR